MLTGVCPASLRDAVYKNALRYLSIRVSDKAKEEARSKPLF